MKEKNKKTSKDKQSHEVSSSVVNVINMGGSLLFYVFAFCWLGIFKGDFLFRLQELSIFLPTSEFLADYMTKPGGLLFYASSFLLQFFYYPYLGAFIFTALLALVQYLVYKNFPLGKRFFLFSLIPSAIALLCVTELDYIMYMMIDQEAIYSYVLGIAFTLVVFLMYKRVKPLWGKITYVVLTAGLFYPVVGFYALIAVLLMAAYELLASGEMKQSFILLGVSVLAILCIPFFYYNCVYDILNTRYIYFYGLPIKNFYESIGLWIPVVLLPVTLFLLLAFYKIKPSDKVTVGSLLLNIVSLIVCVLVVVVFTYKDKNFDIQLKMERAMGKDDFDEVLRIADESKDIIPNRVIVQYRNIALYKKGTLLDKMFAYPHGSAEYKSKSLVSATAMSAHSIFFHYGRLNFSYRWSMETMVKRGMSAEHLKYMAKVATFNGEIALAEKYFDTLKRTFFYKKWADEYSEFLYDRDLFKKQEEYKKVYSLTLYDEEFWEDTNNVEGCILTFFGDLMVGTREMFEYSIASVLTSKKIKPFMLKFQTFLQINRDNPIPTHLQEAALLFLDLKDFEIVIPIDFDPRITARYKEFNRMVNTLGPEVNDEKDKKYKNRFGNTYWYYYFFNRNMKTN